MPRASGTAEAAALDGLDATSATNVIKFVSLHTGEVGTTGANELPTSGSPAYARQGSASGTIWNAGSTSTGTKTNAGTLTFPNNGTSPVSQFGTWSAVTAGTFAIGGLLDSSVQAQSIVVAPGALSLAAA